MPVGKAKPICKVCPKKKVPKPPPPEAESVEDEEYQLLDVQGENEVEVDLVVEEEDEDIYPCPEEEENPSELVTAKYVLDEIFKSRKTFRPSFYCPGAPRTRYENMAPMDASNDHQEEAFLQKTVIDHLASLKVTSEPFCKRQTAIIATIGPSCSEVKDILDLLVAGMNIARINMAYGDRCCQLAAIENFREAVKIFQGKVEVNIPVGLMMDLKGPEIRTGRLCRLYVCDLENPRILIEKGSIVKLTTELSFAEKCTPSHIYIDYQNFNNYIRPGMTIYLDDGVIQLYVQKVDETELTTYVESEGYLRDYRQVHVPMVPFPLPGMTNIDIEDLELALEENFDYVVLPRVYSAEIVENLKGKLIENLLTQKKMREKPVMVLAKISNFQALSNIDEIINAADGIVIQRGDLGLDLPPEKVFVAQKEIIGKCNLVNKPVICSTHLLSSMEKRRLADRSNVFDVACCIDDGADAVCLTGETAIGIYPGDTVEQTHHLLREAEAANARKYHYNEVMDKLKPPIEPIMAIGMAACLVAEKLKASSIIVLTASGKAAKILSWFRPRCPVMAVTRYSRTARQLHLWRSVFPLHYGGPCIKDNWFDNLDLRFQFAISLGMKVGFIKAGDPLVLVTGFGRNTTFTNFLRVVYSSTEPGIFLQHPKEFYDNVYLQRNCRRNTAKEPCISHIDLWTREASGCQCNFDSGKLGCACCAKGGCPCGRAAPRRCTQCGLESHCPKFCNMTLDSRELFSRSGKTFGQIKSPSLKGPAICYYSFVPLPDQRVELQFYRLVNLGVFNGTHCHGGFLQLVDGSSPVSGRTEIKICGNNDRYDPPVLVFADNGPATLIFQLSDDSFVSQFVAYFSFTSISSKQGIYAKGGRRIEDTDCDWLYKDFECRTPESCILTSPGYPGLYAPNRKCRYHIAISSMHTRVTISFASLLLPPKRCKTDFIAIYQGTSSSNPLLKILCDSRKQELTFGGPNLLLEFRSGPPVPPYGYNGFKAFLEFSEKPFNTESSIDVLMQTTESNLLMDSTSSPRFAILKSGCDITFSGNVTRSGTFDTRSLKWSPTCLFTFLGRSTDVVHVSLFNYFLRASSCQNSIEIYDGLYEDGIKPFRKICSPVVKHARDATTGKFIEHHTFVSSDNTFSIMFRRLFHSYAQGEVEFLDGAYLFHDEQVDGTLRPSTLCDVDYYGLSSSSAGQVKNPGSQDLYFNIERPLHCVQRFIPAANQSITLVVNSYRTTHVDPYCHTQCGDGGCFCVLSGKLLSQCDHLLLQSETGQTLSCLCGEFQEDWLPVTIKSWSPVKLVYFVAQFSWETKGFNFTANYSFVMDGICGHHTITSPDGEVKSVRIIPDGPLNYYYHQICTWLLDTKIERQLNVELYTPQNRHCSAWNLTIHHYDESSVDRAGALIETFCPRQRHKIYELPWKTDLVVVRLQATTHTPPEFTLRWRSQVFSTNNRLSDPSPAPPSSASFHRTVFSRWTPIWFIGYGLIRTLKS